MACRCPDELPRVMPAGILDVLLAVLYPPRCPLCGRDLARARGPAVCRGCLARLPVLPPGCPTCAEPGPRRPCDRCAASPPTHAAAHACLAYRRGARACPLRRALLRWKYRADHAAGAALLRIFRECAARVPLDARVVVAVPADRARRIARGFEPARLLAAEAARAHHLPIVDALRRAERSVDQVALGRTGRQANVRAAFSARRTAALRDARVLLVDDVVTTGATAEACARALSRAGAARVELLTLARTVRCSKSANFLPSAPSPLEDCNFCR